MRNILDVYKRNSCSQIIKGLAYYLVIAFFLVFLGNILMHILTTHENADYSKLMVARTSGYLVEGNCYTVTDEDPQMYLSVENISGAISCVHIDFAEPLAQDAFIQVYYPDSQGGYSEARAVTCQQPAGSENADILFESGTYSEIRIDVDASFCLEAVYGNNVVFRTIYSIIDIRYIVWSMCFVLAAVICFLLWRIDTIKRMINRLELKIKDTMKKSNLSKNLLMFGIGILSSVICGSLLESVLSFFRNRSYNPKEAVIFGTLLFFIYSVLFMRDLYRQKIEFMTAFLILLAGISFSVVMPVSLGLSWDDETHYISTIQCARGLSNTLMVADNKMKDMYVQTIMNKEEYTKDIQNERIEFYDDLYDTGDVVATDYTFSITSIGYLPAVFGTWISYGLCLTFSHSIIFIRIFNVLFMAVMIFLSMKNVKTGKMLFAVFAFVPTVFFLASSFSYDTWLTIMLIYGFSRYFKELQDRETPLTFGRFLGIFVPLILALGPKFVYAPLLFLTAHMPRSKFREKKWAYAYYACFVAAAVAIAAVIVYVASGNYDLGTGDLRGGEGVSAMGQLMYIKSNGGQFVKTLFEFLKVYFSYENSAQYLTFMAYMGLVNMPYIPIAILVFAALTDRGEVDRRCLPVISKVSAVIMYILIGAICATAMYIGFTPVGLNTVNGCQGRYILPAVLPVLYMVTRFGGRTIVRSKMKPEYYNIALLAVSIIFLMYNLWTNVAVKY